MGEVGAEALCDGGEGIFRVFDGVVKESSGQRGGIEAHVGEDVRDFEKMGKIGLAGAAELVVVTFGGNFVGAADHPGIFGGAVLAEFLEQFLEAGVELANRAIAVEAKRDFVRRRPGLGYASREDEWQ